MKASRKLVSVTNIKAIISTQNKCYFPFYILHVIFEHIKSTNRNRSGGELKHDSDAYYLVYRADRADQQKLIR